MSQTFEAKQAAREKRIHDRAEAAAERAAKKAREKTLAQLRAQPMTPTQYKTALKRLDVSIVGAASLWGISPRQAQRIAAEGPISGLIARVIKLIEIGKITKEDLL